MFSREILESDDFMRMRDGTKMLYVYLCLEADDEGLLNNVDKVIRMVESSQEDFRELISCGFILPVIGSIYAVTHWNVHNSIPPSKFRKSTICDSGQFLKLNGKIYERRGGIA